MTRGFYDPEYDGMGVNIWPKKGWGVDVGLHHFNGFQALAYARARKGVGESDFTRAGRQQEILLALRDKLAAGGTLLTKVPDLLSAFGSLVETDLDKGNHVAWLASPDHRDRLAAVADELPDSAVSRMVVMRPLVRGGTDPVYGSVQRPDIEAIRLAIQAFIAPPEPSPSPSPTAPG